jgi:hypothetical protein
MLKFSLVLISGAMATACSDQFAQTNQPHQAEWVQQHGAQRVADPTSCDACHGAALDGGTAGVACTDCHIQAGPVRVHAASWTVPVRDHQTFANEFSWQDCTTAVCHGSNLKGANGPSCFTAFGCHEGGPPAPHPVPFAGPEDHGRSAKANLVYCMNCHGRAPNHFDGGFVRDPRILNRSWACSTCHTKAGAHPTFWQGMDDQTAYRATHQDMRSLGVNRINVCGRCHATESLGEGPVKEAPSCFAPSFVNDGGEQMPCHAEGPGTL